MSGGADEWGVTLAAVEQPVTVTIGSRAAGPVVPAGFAGLSFEVGALRPGNAGVTGYLFDPANTSLVTLFRNVGLRNLRVGGGTVDQQIPVGTGGDGFTGIDRLFTFAAAAGARVIYTFRLLNPATGPVPGLRAAHVAAARYIWDRYQDQVDSFAVGNEPDWHAFHTHPGHRADPAIWETVPGVPGSAYPSYLAQWRSLAGAVSAAAPGAPLSGPDTGAYTAITYTPDPATGVSWTERFATGRPSPHLAGITQHHYAGGDPGVITAPQAITSMLSAAWVTGTAIGAGLAGTSYIPYPWLHEHNLAAVTAAGLPYRMTEANDYLGGVAGASDAFASALWALDYLHWWAARGAAGVNFHNKQWLLTDTVVPDPAAPGRYATTPRGYGVKAFSLGSAGQVQPVRIAKPSELNLTAYCTGTAATDHVTIINKTHAGQATDAAVTILPSRPGPHRARVLTLAGGQPGEATGATATLGGATITGDHDWRGTWRPLPAGSGPGVSLTVRAATAAVVEIRGAR